MMNNYAIDAMSGCVCSVQHAAGQPSDRGPRCSQIEFLNQAAAETAEVVMSDGKVEE